MNPSINLPPMNLPPMNLPPMNLPPMNLPPMNLPSMNLPPSCTLVTACYDLNKYSKKCRTTEECLKLIDPLLQIPVFLVIYGSKTTIPAIQMQRQIYGFEKFTKYIQIELEDLWTYQFLQKIKENRNTFWPTRDERTCDSAHHLLQQIRFRPRNHLNEPNKEH